MGLGHVINIKHMVFSGIRFNSRQRVQEWESDMRGNFGLCPQTPQGQTACEKEANDRAWQLLLTAQQSCGWAL